MPELSAETLVRRILQTASSEVSATEPAALRDEPDGVHRHRTRVRRLRGVVGALRREVAPGELDALRASLADWGRELGAVRDAEVRADDAQAALEAVDADDADARRRLVGDERTAYRTLHARLTADAGTERQQLLREAGLSPTVNDPDADADELISRMLAREARRVRRAARRLDGSRSSSHALRKAGRRLRHVAEAVEAAAPGAGGKATRRLARAGKRIHEVLGDQRDADLLRARVEATRSKAFRALEETGPYDEVLGLLHEHATPVTKRVRKAVRRVRKAAKTLP